jgi:cyanophycin synthetase
MQLDVCGIDIVAQDITSPITAETGAVIEVNAAPGFRMHLSPSSGEPINVAAPMLNMLFPPYRSPRIPVIAITGTNGKTTTTRLIAHLVAQAGYHVGCTTSDGIYICNHLVEQGDCTGASSAEKVLIDPTVDFAVLECARGGILRSGLGFDHCDVSVITNISDDHLGMNEIETLEDLAAVKEVVARSTFDHGYAVLNADDDRVYDMASRLDCHIALFSLHDGHGRLRRHRDKGGLCITIEAGFIVLYNGLYKTDIARVDEIPLTFSGKSACMTSNLLAAVLAAIIQRFSLPDIQEGLRTFIPSPELTPGRMNLFEFPGFQVMVDYGHNTGGLLEQKKFIDQVGATFRVGVIAGVGDRRDQDIFNIGYVAAQMFDKVIIRMDKDLRGRTADEIEALLRAGMYEADPAKEATAIADEVEAILYAIAHGRSGAFIMIFSDDVPAAIACVRKMQEQFKKESLPTSMVSE